MHHLMCQELTICLVVSHVLELFSGLLFPVAIEVLDLARNISQGVIRVTHVDVSISPKGPVDIPCVSADCLALNTTTTAITLWILACDSDIALFVGRVVDEVASTSKISFQATRIFSPIGSDPIVCRDNISRRTLD